MKQFVIVFDFDERNPKHHIPTHETEIVFLPRVDEESGHEDERNVGTTQKTRGSLQ